MPLVEAESRALMSYAGSWARRVRVELKRPQKAENRAMRQARYAMAWEADQALRGQAVKPTRSVCGAQTRSGAPCQAPAVRGGS